MPASFVIAAKDLRQRLRDRSALVLAIVAPLGLAFILSLLIPTGDNIEVHRYGTVDLDGGRLATTFTGRVLGGLDDSDFGEVVKVSSETEARTRARRGDLAAAFVIPKGFTDDVTSGRGPTIEIVGNADSPIAVAVAQSIANSFAQDLNSTGLAAVTVVTLEGGSFGDKATQTLNRQAADLAAPISLTNDRAASREFDSKTFFAAGMAIFFLFFTAQFGVLSLLAERRDGTMARLLAAPIATWDIVVAKSLSTFVFGTISMSALVVASTFLMGAHWGSPPGVALLILGAVISAMGLTSLLGSFAKTDEQAAGITSIVAVTLGMLGGTFFPISQGPAVINLLTRLTPHHWLMQGFGDLSGGSGGPSDVITPVAALIAFGLVTGAYALVRSRRMVMGL